MNKFLVVSCETSGLNKQDSSNPSVAGTGYYQSLSWGLIVVDNKFNIIDELYTEISWDGKAKWETEAEVVHKLTVEYLAVNGIKELEAVEEIGSFIFEHFEANEIPIVGHNPGFAISFLDAMFKRYDISLKFSNKLYDLTTLGEVLLDTTKRWEIFNILGCKVGARNALITSRNIVKCFKTLKTMWSTLL
jgi:DNA polymerase III epsilon subunit-like protein